MFNIKYKVNVPPHLFYQSLSESYKNNEVLIFQVEVFISSLFLKFVAKEYFHLKYSCISILIGNNKVLINEVDDIISSEFYNIGG